MRFSTAERQSRLCQYNQGVVQFRERSNKQPVGCQTTKLLAVLHGYKNLEAHLHSSRVPFRTAGYFQ